MSSNEHIPHGPIKVNKLADKLGYGSGPISAVAVRAEAGNAALSAADAAIISPKILVPVSKDDDGNMIEDDGCGDGRFTKLVRRGNETLRRSLDRPKVFGGAVAMTFADKVGSGRAKNASIQDTFVASINTLIDNHIDYGAHTAEGAHGADCGCGAIDKSPQAMQLVSVYRQHIIANCNALGLSSEGLDVVLDNFTDYAEQTRQEAFSGRKVMDKIIDSGKVVKELGGQHIEARIVLNFVQNYTVDQSFVRHASDGKVDVFAVDVWRVEQLAEKLHPTDAAAQQQALQSMLVYTLAVAATLTKGDLPVYVIKQEITQPSRELVAA